MGDRRNCTYGTDPRPEKRDPYKPPAISKEWAAGYSTRERRAPSDNPGNMQDADDAAEYERFNQRWEDLRYRDGLPDE